MTLTSEDAALGMLRNKANRAERYLRSEVAAFCPGEHYPVQHRDAKPPWCKACGRDDRGNRWNTPTPATQVATDEAADVAAKEARA